MPEKGPRKGNSTSIKPGQVLNPGGRPKTPESVKLAFAGMMPLALAALRNILDGTDEAAKASDRLKAAELVFDRNLGKAVETVNMQNSALEKLDTVLEKITGVI